MNTSSPRKDDGRDQARAGFFQSACAVFQRCAGGADIINEHDITVGNRFWVYNRKRSAHVVQTLNARMRANLAMRFPYARQGHRVNGAH